MISASITALLFWGSVTILLYTFAGYGLVIRWLAARRPLPVVPLPSGPTLPIVTVVLIAHNEEMHIVERLRNLLDSNYPPERVSILLVSDGSTDSTVIRAQTLKSPRIKVLERATSNGKTAGINFALPQCDGEIIVFTDARQRFEKGTIIRLVAHFSDPAIGAVSGALEISPSASTTGAGIDSYWRYEKALRAAESRFDSCIGCTGAVYAVRRSLLAPIPDDTLLDDVVIPMTIAATGARVIHEPTAIAFDPQPLEPPAERRRKQRTLAGGFQMLFRYPTWLLPTGHRLWWQLLAHKYLRLFAPFFLIIAFITNVLLAGHSGYAAMLGVQLVFYVCAAWGAVSNARRWKILSLPAGFVFLNLQTLRGLAYYLTSSGRTGWK